MDSTAVKRNYHLCLFLELTWTLSLGSSVMVVYYQAHGLSQAEIYSLQSTLSIAAIIFNIPFGHLADHRLGLRKAMMLGTIGLAVASVCFAYCQNFWQFELALICTGASWSMIGGTTQALVTRTYDASVEGVSSEKYARFETRNVQMRMVSAFIGAGLGSYLVAQVGINFVYEVQPLMYVLGMYAVLRVKEPPRWTAETAERSFNDVRKVVRMMLLENRAVRWVVSYGALMCTTLVGIFWLFQPKLQEAKLPVWSFGLVYDVKTLFTLGLSCALPWLQRHWLRSDVRLQLAQFGVLTLSVIGAGWFMGMPGAALLLFGHAFCSGMWLQHLNTVLFKLLPKSFENRTTEMSVSATAQSLLFAVVSPSIGVVTDTFSMNVALLGMGCTFLVIGGVLLYLLYGVEMKK